MPVFVSHSSENVATVRLLDNLLLPRGISLWFAPDHIPVGAEYAVAIADAVRDCSAFLLLFDAAADASRHVLREVELADGMGRTLICLRLDESRPDRLAYYLSGCQWIDWTPGEAVPAAAIASLQTQAATCTGPAADRAATAICQANFAQIDGLLQNGLYDAGLALAQRARSEHEKHQDECELIDLQWDEMVAQARGESGDHQGAVRDYRAIVERYAARLGPQHELAIEAMGGLAAWLSKAQNLPEALADYTRMVDVSSTSLGPTHDATVTARRGRGLVLIRSGATDQARAELTDLIADLQALDEAQEIDEVRQVLDLIH